MLIGFVFFIQLLLSIAVSANSSVSQQIFNDLKSHWAEKTILSMAEKGYIKGYATENGFIVKPDSNITRAEFLTILIKTKNLSIVNGNAKKFTDVKDGDWFKQTIDIVSSNGIAKGYPDNSFRPNAPITRAEISELLVNMNSWKEIEVDKDVQDFKDVTKQLWYYKSIMILRSKGIVNGYQDNTYKPESFSTRAEAIVVLF